MRLKRGDILMAKHDCDVHEGYILLVVNVWAGFFTGKDNAHVMTADGMQILLQSHTKHFVKIGRL